MGNKYKAIYGKNVISTPSTELSKQVTECKQVPLMTDVIWIQSGALSLAVDFNISFSFRVYRFARQVVNWYT